MWIFWSILAIVGIGIYTRALIQEARNRENNDRPDNDWGDLVIMSEDELLFSDDEQDS